VHVAADEPAAGRDGGNVALEADLAETYELRRVGTVRSSLSRREDAPMQGYEGAPEAWVEVEPGYGDALAGISAGDQLVLLTWLHLGDRSILKTHPRSDPDLPLTGVFATRSPDRPNPIGLHRVRVLARDGLRLRVAPLEAIGGTPVIDVKPVLNESNDA
jgi:tRNA-Thr(GGU) m(6)t(6)A37 methyltransferase TsaA